MVRLSGVAVVMLPLYTEYKDRCDLYCALALLPYKLSGAILALRRRGRLSVTCTESPIVSR